jgi:hypothetical protein
MRLGWQIYKWKLFSSEETLFVFREKVDVQKKMKWSSTKEAKE